MCVGGEGGLYDTRWVQAHVGGCGREGGGGEGEGVCGGGKAIVAWPPTATIDSKVGAGKAAACCAAIARQTAPAGYQRVVLSGCPELHKLGAHKEV